MVDDYMNETVQHFHAILSLPQRELRTCWIVATNEGFGEVDRV